MSIKNSWVLVFFVAGVASCATSPKSAPIRETTAEIKAEEPVDSTSVEDATQAPEGEISLDGAKSTEVDIGVTGTSTGPVVVDSAITQPSVEGDTEVTPEQLAEALLKEAKAAEAKAKSKDKSKSGKVAEAPVEPEVPGQLIIDSGAENPAEPTAP